MNFDSYYLSYANYTLNWLPMDTEERFNKNLKTNYDKLLEYGWIDKQFTYKFNNLGFRCEDFKSNTDIMFLGCSFTKGIGLPLEDTWAYKVSNRLNMSYANLAMGGSSSDAAFRMCLGYIKRLNPKICIYLEPPGVRFEFISNNHFEAISIRQHNLEPGIIKLLWRDDDHSDITKTKNTLAIQQLCDLNNVKFIKFNADEINQDDKARDLAHPGVEANDIFSNKVIERI